MKKFAIIAIAIIIAAGVWYSIAKGKSDSTFGTDNAIPASVQK
jgi:hypothetical protein